MHICVHAYLSFVAREVMYVGTSLFNGTQKCVGVGGCQFTE